MDAVTLAMTGEFPERNQTGVPGKSIYANKAILEKGMSGAATKKGK